MSHHKFVKTVVFFSILFGFIMLNFNVSLAGTVSSDINGINEKKYPGIKSAIQEMQKKHGNYNFQVYYTGIDWTEAITMEYQGHQKSPKNLFSKSGSYQGKWFCPICGSRTYDTGWYCASKEAIEYMMDPRNSLSEKSIYQFKNLETSDVSNANIETIIRQEYPERSYINNPTAMNAIVKASTENHLNGYSILAKIINEQGKGTSPLATGAGYEGVGVGYYNFFNIGAYGNGTSTVMKNGLKYAQDQGWNSVEKSIVGGAKFYKSQYVGRGQNTLYYQRFNVIHVPSLFSHQYQQDVMGAETSARLLYTYYTKTNTETTIKHNFVIPLYENMPSSACARPSTTENSKLDYEEATVLKDKLEIKASPNSSRIIAKLNKGEKVNVLKRASKVSSDGNYWDEIYTVTDGTYGYVVRSGITQSLSLPSYVFDAQYYAQMNQDIVAILGNNEQTLLSHFINSGIKEGRKSSPTFCVAEYLYYNQDLSKVYGKDYEKFYEHFVNYGAAEGRRGSEEFDINFYKNYYEDMAKLSNIKAMEHYVKIGRKAGRIGGLSTEIENIVYDQEVYMACNQDLLAVFGNNPARFKQHWIRERNC